MRNLAELRGLGAEYRVSLVEGNRYCPKLFVSGRPQLSKERQACRPPNDNSRQLSPGLRPIQGYAVPRVVELSFSLSAKFRSLEKRHGDTLFMTEGRTAVLYGPPIGSLEHSNHCSQNMSGLLVWWNRSKLHAIGLFDLAIDSKLPGCDLLSFGW